ncbi:amino acid/amide ABC transporter substrate-binding protein, HAAT family [Polaromonas sp. YR568]|uniref:ABC transporter substrate-binding protein n=1 Tax=Polaromonas sp. YR568 TaxID=1855301 RepID=UPI0008DEB4EB|nr:ABC transporter substrate-binding protein [Polaromonas sp. YR568]SFU89556.1 amino acid/amide ABC transporter substrate-binding protein, HAAT family [Polaromonas sp. YR568]
MSNWKVLPRFAAWGVFALAQAAGATQIVVGQVGPLSGMDANQGRAYSAGLQLHFNQVNKSGGVAGHTFALVRKDDGGRAEDTVAATRQLLAESKPMVLSGYAGGRNIADLVSSGLLQSEKIALVGYRTSEIAPETPYLYSVRAGLRDEVNKIGDHLATVGINRLGLFYEEGLNVAALLAAVDEMAKRTGAQILVKASYPAGTTSADRAVSAMIAGRPQAVLMVATGAAAASFIEQYREGGGTARLFSYSGADIEQMSKRLSDEQMQGVVIAQVTPSPYKVSSRLTKDFADTLAKSEKPDVPVSYAMMEGYIAAKIIVEATRRMGARASREAFVQALDSIDMLDLGGYSIGFKPNMRSGSRFVEMSIVTAGRIRQ